MFQVFDALKLLFFLEGGDVTAHGLVNWYTRFGGTVCLQI